jgi:ATP-grasp ribosomal peptide maturase
VGCAYYRRPTMPVFAQGLADGERHWAGREARRGLGGVLGTVPRWLNHPWDISRAEYKPVQLAAAAAAGLRTPPSLITSDPDDARAFVATVGRAVYKPLSGAGVDRGDRHELIYTNEVRTDEIDDGVRGTLHLFQAWVVKDHEIRLTVVDDRMFAVRIDSTSDSGHLDWRTDYPALRYSVVDAPGDVVWAVRELLAGLRLRFGALDFVVGPDGSWTFLEINANGQWAWLQEHTGLPIASAIADALTATTP